MIDGVDLPQQVAPPYWAPLNDRLKPILCLMLLAGGLSGTLLVRVTGVTLAGKSLTGLPIGAAWATGAASSVGLSAGVMGWTPPASGK